MPSQIKGKLYLYSELLFNESSNIGYEIHGQYKLHKRNVVFVREYQSLKFEFWPFSKNFPFSKIIICEIFNNSKIIVGIDMHGRLYFDKLLSQTISGFSIKVDEMDMNNYKEMTNLSEILSKYLEGGAVFKSKMNNKSIIKSFAYVRLFAYVRSFFLKPLADALGKDWKPPQAI